MFIPKDLQKIIYYLNKKSAKVIIIGGAVRDNLLNIKPKDFDIEVYNIDSLGKLESLIKPFGVVNIVGKSFGILKLKSNFGEYDFSLPRLDTKIDIGHKGFSVEINSKLDYKNAFKRRDFTINAIGYDFIENKIIDPFNGLEDLKNKKLKHIDSDTFIQDPLRVYRAISFISRFNLKLDNKTYELCKSMVKNGQLEELPKERIWQEWQKFLLKSNKPSVAFELMKKLGIIGKYYLELNALINIPQDKKWHPEGDVWIHTMMVLDEMAQLLKKAQKKDTNYKLIMLLSALCHDLGKSTTTIIKADGRISSIGHEIAGLEPTKKLINKLTNNKTFVKEILPLVEHHLKPHVYYRTGAKNSTIKKLSTKVNIENLIILAKADILGRGVEREKKECKACKWLLKKAKELKVNKNPPKPLIMGRDLIKLGLKPSIEFTNILNKLYKMQLAGEFKSKEDAYSYITSNIC